MARRNIVNGVMLTITGLCTVITVSALFLILGYLVINGWRSLDFNFFTKLPLSPGEEGGGVANAIVGSGVLILIAAAIGIPVGFLGAIYLAEFGGKTVPMLIRYTADLLNGVPSIVIGIFAWTVIVVPMHHFSAWAGGFALSLMMIPIGLRATEQFLRGVPNSLREASLALGASRPARS
jgi:phosphate transport system permease protein